jgi:hypothetical protein
LSRLGSILASQPVREEGRCLVNLDDPVLQLVLGHRDAVRAKRVGLDHVHTDFQEGAMHLLHGFRVRDHQVIVAAVVLLAAEVLGCEALVLKACPHGASNTRTFFSMARDSGDWCTFDRSWLFPSLPN